MEKFLELLKNYKPYDKQEEADIEFMKKCYEMTGDLLTRENDIVHLTSSAFIVNKEHTKVLCIYHNIYKAWCWVGGHADGDDDLLNVAIKETREETSLENFKILSKEPVSVDSLPVFSHVRKGKNISGHIHLSVAYLLEADEHEKIKILEDENSAIGWLTFDELIESSKGNEKFMIPVYKKIVERLKNGEY